MPGRNSSLGWRTAIGALSVITGCGAAAAQDAAAQADVMQAQALLDQSEINLGYTEIRSPIDGRIGLASFTVGNLVQPSSGRLATIVSQDPIYVQFQASERDVLDYKRRLAES